MSAEIQDQTPRPQSIFGDYYGADLDEVARLQKGLLVDQGLHRVEPALYEQKWWDYRTLDTVRATYLFAYFYRKAYRRMMCRQIGIERGQYRKGYKGDDIFALNRRDYQGFWKARQAADRLGVRYDFYNNFAMRWAVERLWKMLPRPSQLYSASFLQDLEAAWAEENRSAIQLPLDPWYLLENYEGHLYQCAFQQWLCERIEERRNPEFSLAQYVYIEPRISEEVAGGHFGQELLTRAQRIAV